MLQTPIVNLSSLASQFSYRNISAKKRLNDKDITFFSYIEANTSFIKFAYIGDDQQFVSTNNAPGGWKLHIAIDDSVEGNVALAWDQIISILIAQRIAESKVLKPGELFTHMNQTQSGKQITIYQFFNPNRNWNLIANQIESRLRNASIVPGRFSLTDKPIVGSQYISYRNDLSQDGKHAITAQEAMKYLEDVRYNPFGSPDPFLNISVQFTPKSTSYLGII